MIGLAASLLLGLLALTLPAGAATTPATGSIGASPTSGQNQTPAWSFVPLSQSANFLSRSAIHLLAGPGQTVSDTAVLTNYSDQTLDFDVYGSDAYNTRRLGVFTLNPPNVHPKDVGSWITLPVNQYDLPGARPPNSTSRSRSRSTDTRGSRRWHRRAEPGPEHQPDGYAGRGAARRGDRGLCARARTPPSRSGRRQCWRHLLELATRLRLELGQGALSGREHGQRGVERQGPGRRDRYLRLDRAHVQAGADRRPHSGSARGSSNRNGTACRSSVPCT